MQSSSRPASIPCPLTGASTAVLPKRSACSLSLKKRSYPSSGFLYTRGISQYSVRARCFACSLNLRGRLALTSAFLHTRKTSQYPVRARWDLNPRRRLRRPKGCPNYPTGPMLSSAWPIICFGDSSMSVREQPDQDVYQDEQQQGDSQHAERVSNQRIGHLSRPPSFQALPDVRHQPARVQDSPHMLRDLL